MDRTAPKAPRRARSFSGRTGWVRPLASDQLSGLRFARSRDDALLVGVCGGLGARLGVEPVLVRIAFVVLSFAGALGVLAYLVAWSISLDPGDRRAPRPREPSPTQSFAFGAIALGAVLILRSIGLWLGDQVGIPLIIAAAGAGVIYVGSGRERKARRLITAHGDVQISRPPLVNLVLGGLLVVGGVGWFVTTNRSFEGIFAVLLSVAVTAAGLAVVFGPWVYRLANQLGSERRDRIRSEERSELAAHLHDSVLQTLALIQRNAGNPRKMASLARRQERELRSWLYGHPSADLRRLDTFVEAVEAIEQEHEVTIDTIVVGEFPQDERTEAVVLALREAATNAARHSGAEEISIYVEREADEISAYVRDRGKGFDPETVPENRRGIADSIRARIERQGGTVTITSAPGEGCEVQITMPLMNQ
ncbi:MAG TPA: PspC domain-containing protein [Actinomycetota bacterium]|nr:PspC domain-containing protein [Actinomycetota bacterium]